MLLHINALTLFYYKFVLLPFSFAYLSKAVIITDEYVSDIPISFSSFLSIFRSLHIFIRSFFGSSVFQEFRQQTNIFFRLFIEKLDVTAVWYDFFTDMGDMFFQQLE